MKNNWRNKGYIKDADGKKVRVISKWKYRIYLLSFIFIVLCLSTIFIFIVTASENSQVLSITNKTINLNLNINHKIDFSKELYEVINSTLERYK